MSELDLLAVAARGMDAERIALDVAARNVAAAQAATPEHPYPRLVARFAAPHDDDGVPDPDPDPDAPDDPLRSRYLGTVASGETADALTEMLGVLEAQRAYEAHAAVFEAGKRLAERTLAIGGP